MPYRPSDANHWYYRVFKPSVENRYLLQNEPDDWSRLQVWDGKELKPAMGKGFFGTVVIDDGVFAHRHLLLLSKGGQRDGRNHAHQHQHRQERAKQPR